MQKRKVTIRNLSKQIKQFTLLHKEVCVTFGKCSCVNGLPLSIHVPVGGKTVASSAIFKSEEIRNSVRKSEISVVADEEAKGSPEKPKTEATKGKGKSKGKAK